MTTMEHLEFDSEAEAAEFVPFKKSLDKDMKAAAAAMSDQEARYLVGQYYRLQHERITANNQIRQLGGAGEPVDCLGLMGGQMATLEQLIPKQMKIFAEQKAHGRWALGICGIGPVLAGGLLAHIDATRAQTAGDVWNFAGLNPGVKWEKGQKRPFNADLKVLAYKIGESFVKNQNRKGDDYGHFYAERKALEMARNDAGELAHEAERALAGKKYNKDTEAFKAYSVGKLPAAHLHARARRYAVKLFLSHFHLVARFVVTGQVAPKPYAVVHMGHGHAILPPKMAVVEGLEEAVRREWGVCR